MGTTRWRARVVAAAKPGGARPWKRCAPRVSGTPSPCGWPPTSERSGQPGPPTGSKACSAPRRPSKGATAFCHTCSTSSGACRSSATRSGPSSTMSMVAQRMARHPQRAFSDGRFQISLKRYSPISRSCLGLDNAKTRSCYVTDSRMCPALSGYPNEDIAKCLNFSYKAPLCVRCTYGILGKGLYTLERGCESTAVGLQGVTHEVIMIELPLTSHRQETSIGQHLEML